MPGLGSGPGAGGANSQLQLNIDRLFAQRVSVFAPTPLPSEGLVLGGPALDAAASASASAASVGCRALDALLATVIKAALKAAIEATRSRSFWRTSQLFTDLAFLRRCAVALLPGGSASSTSGSASSSSSSGGAGGSSSAAAAVAAAAAAASSTARQDVESLHEQLVLSLQARGAQGQGAADAQALAVQEGIRRISDLHALVL